MKFAAIAIILPTAISGFAFTPANTGRAFSTSLNAGSIVYYSTSTGNTETVATYIKDVVGCDMEDIGDAVRDRFRDTTAVLVEAPTGPLNVMRHGSEPGL